MELTFTNTNGLYVAEFNATDHFNLHIEGGGAVRMYRKTSGTAWQVVASLRTSVVDTDIAVNTSADFRIECDKEPTTALITNQ